MNKIKLEPNEYFMQRNNELTSDLKLIAGSEHCLTNVELHKDLNFLNKKFTKFYKVILIDTYNNLYRIHTVVILKIFDFDITTVMYLNGAHDFNIYGNKFNIIHDAIEQDKLLIALYLYGQVKYDLPNDIQLDIFQTALENKRYKILSRLLKINEYFDINYEEGFLLDFAFYFLKDAKACHLLLRNGATVKHIINKKDRLKILLSWIRGVDSVIEIWEFCSIRISNYFRFRYWNNKNM